MSAAKGAAPNTVSRASETTVGSQPGVCFAPALIGRGVLTLSVVAQLTRAWGRCESISESAGADKSKKEICKWIK